jgi:hypothetical protein
MADISVIVTGDREVGLRFEQFPQELHEQLKAAIEGLTGELADRVRAAVPRKTGKLASLIVERITDRPEKIVGSVFISGDFAKAAALEYGAHHSTKVRAHTMRLDHAWGRAMLSPEVVDVAAYSRVPNIAERRFLRGPELAMEAQITAELEGVVNKAVEAA